MVSVHTFGPGRIIIGRSPDNEICINSKFVSRHHAQLISDEDGCIVEDLNSTNGVFFGERQVKKQLLTSGDSVAIGAHDLVYTDLRDAGENEDEEHDKDKTSATVG
jgi:pSer/pThr/pTyr-binding forkhead associated (FHA) protein